jgi:DNA repair exonuclease SbcCD ATPase subunit
MINISKLTVRNFMSVGNATQAVNFDRRDLTLVLGENLDLGGDGARNGTGKTTIINALSFALYGQALTNIRKDNLVNKTNNKNMLVSLEFSIDNKNYRIERGRKPNILKLYVDNEQQVDRDESQGDSRETQDEIERMLGLSHDMFRHVVALNTYTEPFLSLKANDQRTIIEQLLGITLLSERAERIKEYNKQTKDSIQQEEFRIRATQDANKRIEEQIASLQKRALLWDNKKTEDVIKLQTAVNSLEHIDIDAEVQAHRDLEAFHGKKKIIDECNRWIRQIDQDDAKLIKQSEQYQRDLADMEDHKCFACGTVVHDDSLDAVKQQRLTQLKELALQILTNDTQRHEHLNEIDDQGELGIAPTVFYDDIEQALNHRNSLETLRRELATRSTEVNPYTDQISEMQSQALQEISYDHLNKQHIDRTIQTFPNITKRPAH